MAYAKHDVEPEREMKDMYHEVVRESSVDLEGKGASTETDVKDMYRMGKEQQFKRIFYQSTMICFTSMIQATWEVILVANSGGLVNGGLAGLFWSYIWTFTLFIPIVMSLAEMASMAPTSGGQYHWTSEFAPPKYQKFLSYLSGWLATLSWQAGTAGGGFVCGTLLQGLIAAYDTSYKPTHWQGTLLAIAIAALQTVVNIPFAAHLPRIQKVMVFPHALGWMAVMVVLWVLAPHASAHDVFLSFTSNGGWEPIGLSVMVGQITTVYFLILSDSAAHLSEEVKTASKSVPIAMMWSFGLNGLVGFVILVTFLFAVPDIPTLLDPDINTSGYAIIYILQQAAGKGGIPLMLIILSVIITGVIDSQASTSRQTFAFARDYGLPFRDWFSKVHKATVPANSVLFTFAFSAILSLINIGSTVAFNAIISLQLMALMATYSVSIGCVLWKRTLGPRDLPVARWSLGKWGPLVNGVAFVYSIQIMFWTGWPSMRNPTTETFNWAVVMFAAVIGFSLVYYALHGRKQYSGPVVLVRPG